MIRSDIVPPRLIGNLFFKNSLMVSKQIAVVLNELSKKIA
jgi:hypothetical protein